MCERYGRIPLGGGYAILRFGRQDAPTAVALWCDALGRERGSQGSAGNVFASSPLSAGIPDNGRGGHLLASARVGVAPHNEDSCRSQNIRTHIKKRLPTKDNLFLFMAYIPRE